ncbi:MAG: ribosomal-processing cysteine protease Prp [Clostridia bacterium]|nr:ribosomal-processing cysteine protease Prp [Clostridia bacterium]
MIDALFYRNPNGDITGFTISGHAGYADCGKDIVCAAVSAMTSLVINTLEEVFYCGGNVEIDEDGKISYSLPQKAQASKESIGILCGFKLQLEEYASEYPKNINVRFGQSK